MNTSTYFFYSYLPQSKDLQSKYSSLMLKYPLLDRYLYVTSLLKLLGSLNQKQQIEFMAMLESSEEAAQRWIGLNHELEQILREHLERGLLATK